MPTPRIQLKGNAELSSPSIPSHWIGRRTIVRDRTLDLSEKDLDLAKRRLSWENSHSKNPDRLIPDSLKYIFDDSWQTLDWTRSGKRGRQIGEFWNPEKIEKLQMHKEEVKIVPPDHVSMREVRASLGSNTTVSDLRDQGYIVLEGKKRGLGTNGCFVDPSIKDDPRWVDNVAKSPTRRSSRVRDQSQVQQVLMGAQSQSSFNPAAGILPESYQLNNCTTHPSSSLSYSQDTSLQTLDGNEMEDSSIYKELSTSFSSSNFDNSEPEMTTGNPSEEKDSTGLPSLVGYISLPHEQSGVLPGYIKYIQGRDRKECEVPFSTKDKLGQFTVERGTWVRFSIVSDKEMNDRAINIELLDCA